MNPLSEKEQASPRSSMNDAEKASKWLQNTVLGILNAAKKNTDLNEDQISRSLENSYREFCQRSGFQPDKNIEHSCGGLSE